MGKARIDRTGQKFNRLTVLKHPLPHAPNKALCRCDCGTEKEVFIGNVVNGATTSCGCYRNDKLSEVRHEPFKDMTGQRFGLLVARVPHHRERMGWCWTCDCDCGNEHIAPGYLLRAGRVRSCGCFPNSLPALETAAKERERLKERVLDRIDSALSTLEKQMWGDQGVDSVWGDLQEAKKKLEGMR